MSHLGTLDEKWLVSTDSCEIRGTSEDVASEIWFKSKPVTDSFCYRVTQLQLCTDSRDQGFADDKSKGNWTWFEIVILPDEQATEPRRNKDGKELAWISHNNQLANQDSTMHFGAIFDRRCELLVNLEVGDVLAVRACARFSGWANYAKKGYIVARTLKEDLFTPHSWTLQSAVRPKLLDVEDGSYSFVSTTSCTVRSSSDEMQSKIWFTTPSLDEHAINKLESVQLVTFSRLQLDMNSAPETDNSFSWFDLVILEKSTDTVPKTKNGISLVWRSHSNSSKFIGRFGHQGQLFDIQDIDSTSNARAKEIVQIRSFLDPGDVIAVRVCAQFRGWENYAESGQLIVRISNISRDLPEVKEPEDVTDANDAFQKLQGAIYEYYQQVTPKGEPPFKSATTALLASEARADLLLSLSTDPPPAYESSRPLRLLSCDGGGVRGVSTLRILKRIMAQVSEKEKRTVQPWEYFDMIAGTSTGALIALMLGRLRMSVEECEEEYGKISSEVFGTKHSIFNAGSVAVAFSRGSHLYESQPLVDAIRRVVKERLGDSKARLLEGDGKPRCKVLIMSALASNVSDGNTAVHLRTYNVGPDVPAQYNDWEIWEAARATSAAPAFFESFERDGKRFVDGGVGFNNPILELLGEARSVYGKACTLGCVISLGTGIPPDLKLDTGLFSIRDFVNVATNSEIAHRQFKGFSDILPLPDVADSKKYWRFNMSKQLSDKDWVVKETKRWYGKEKETVGYEKVMVEMDDYASIGLIQELTDLWLDKEATKKDLKACVNKLTS
ncbi:hypothetical protein VKT23_020118 [Stygiomarasmius scandens]|uniref:PNPLA domain-containing protein n=1 Tax=Marasmiellus scandens TaxID=2682957 RepID=A0ABR1ILN0_9AGAR